ncbi:MAG: hypothetical protein AB7V16_09375 [Vulcanibacillus sp.]
MRNQKLFIGALAFALGIGMVATPAVVNAVDTYPQAAQAAQAQSANGNGFGKYFAGSSHSTVAATLGLTDDELYALRVEGKSIAQIANEKGIATESLTSTLVVAKIAQIEQLYTDGTITLAQKDLMISQTEDRTADMINRTQIGNQGANKGYGKSQRLAQNPDFQAGQGNVNGGGFGTGVNNQ